MSSLADLVRHLKASNVITHPAIEAAMLAIDRKLFCRSSTHSMAYEDCPLPINSQVTISAPHMHAIQLADLLRHGAFAKPNARILDVGYGSGILLAYAAEVMRQLHPSEPNSGRFAGVEYLPDIAEFGIQNLKSLPFTKQLMDQGRLVCIQGDGHSGVPAAGPYDGIHVGAAASSIPAALVEQLAPGGTMIIPVGPVHGDQYLMTVKKGNDGQVTAEQTIGVRFVPLVKAGR